MALGNGAIPFAIAPPLYIRIVFTEIPYARMYILLGLEERTPI